MPILLIKGKITKGNEYWLQNMIKLKNLEIQNMGLKLFTEDIIMRFRNHRKVVSILS